MSPEQFQKMREALPAQQREALDRRIGDKMQEMLERGQRLEKLVVGLEMLHHPGSGERAGFCDECGQVMPCHTMKMLGPFLVDAAG